MNGRRQTAGSALEANAGVHGAAADRRLQTKLESLRTVLGGYRSAIVAYSGGVDSSFLMSVAHGVLGQRALAVTARSPSVPASELSAAAELAARYGWQHRVMDTHELEDSRYAANGPRRCYFCKTELYANLRALASAEGWEVIASGANVDDLGDFRPGLDAARQQDIRSPLVDAGLTKADVRMLSKEAGLPTWDKPAMACLSSRIPYGTPVTIETLGRIEAAEAVLRKHGFRALRVRHHGNLARIEVPGDDLPAIIRPGTREAIVRGVRDAGYLYVSIDLAGLRSGSMNEALAGRQKRPVTG